MASSLYLQTLGCPKNRVDSEIMLLMIPLEYPAEFLIDDLTDNFDAEFALLGCGRVSWESRCHAGI